MKKIAFILFLFFFFCTSVFSQTNFNVEIDTGLLAIKKDAGFVFSGTISYTASNKVTPYVNYLYSNIESNDSDLKYDFSKISIGTYYGLSEGNITLSSITGFSYLFFDNSTVNSNALGIDLGILVNFNNDKRFSYGFKLINTFSAESNGGILQSGIFFKYAL